MREFVVNIFEVRLTPSGRRRSAAMKFRTAGFDAIKVIDDSLLDLANRVSKVMIERKKEWKPSTQGIYPISPKRDTSTGVFHGIIEVGSPASGAKLRNLEGVEPYPVHRTNDLWMRDFFYRIEMPPDNEVGFLVVQRLGIHTAATALQQMIKLAMARLDHKARFSLVTDSKAFEEWMAGRMTTVRVDYVAQDKDARGVIRESQLLGQKPRRKRREAMRMEYRVDRPITAALRRRLTDWLLSDQAQRPDIVRLPVQGKPDKVSVGIEIEVDGKTHQQHFHPEKLASMGLISDLSEGAKWDDKGRVDVATANVLAARLCDDRRAALVTS